ncbi:urocortin [Tiliqua scincoides]|uniref:urocortin n=1 Tax=Tiliqua scincoides TaxID=71010 RepID=UPI003463070A
MRRVPLHTLVALLLLVSQAPPGASPAEDFDSSAERGLSLRLRLLLLGEGPAARWPLPPPLPAPGPDVRAPLVRFLHQTGPTWELRHRLAELGQRLKRHDPPLSIDLTFYLLRQMMEISRAQSQQAQAEQNRLLFDSVGK